MHKLKIAKNISRKPRGRPERFTFATTAQTVEMIQKQADRYHMSPSQYVDMLIQRAHSSQRDIHGLSTVVLAKLLSSVTAAFYRDGVLDPDEREALLIISNEFDREILQSKSA